MKYYMCGFDAEDPAGSAKKLRKKGIDTIVLFGPKKEWINQVRDEGVDVQVGFGALGVGGEKTGWAIDAYGESRKWFGSGCPNNPEVFSSHLERALEWTEHGATGLWLDGARFASPASAEGMASFWTCFCPRCMEKAEAMGFSPDKLRNAAKKAAEGKCGFEALGEWFAFRARCVAELFSQYAEKVHKQNPQLQANAFVFAASLCRFVGQTENAVQQLDIVAPMLYRKYPQKEGPATLNHEWAALRPYFPEVPQDILERGYRPEHLRQETKAAIMMLKKGQKCAPVIQIDDEKLASSIQEVFKGGANGCGFFAYNEEWLERLPVLE